MMLGYIGGRNELVLANAWLINLKTIIYHTPFYQLLIDPAKGNRKDALKALQAHSYVAANYLQEIKHILVKNRTIFLAKSKVSPSFKVSAVAHQAWVAIDMDNADVLFAHCTCIAGLV